MSNLRISERHYVVNTSHLAEEVSKSGAVLAQKTGTTVKDIVGGIERVAGIMTGIVASSREQSNGIAQVTQSVAQMDQTTQQNAALVEEAAATATALQEQAAHLAALMARFRTGQPAARGARQATVGYLGRYSAHSL
jgi:methyl-accepting chemotaxis protein